MHGGEGEKKHRRHMWPVPAARTAGNTTSEAPHHPGAPPVVVAAADSDHSSPDSLLKVPSSFCFSHVPVFGCLPSRWRHKGVAEMIIFSTRLWMYFLTIVNMMIKGRFLSCKGRALFSVN